MAKLMLGDKFTLIELRAFVLTQQPKTIGMTAKQISWYKRMVRHRVDQIPPTFRGIPIKLNGTD